MPAHCTGGKQIDQFEGHSKLLGKVLEATSVDLSVYGISIDQLTNGTSNLTFEELQFLLAKHPATSAISDGLQEKLSLRKITIMITICKYSFG